MFSGVYTPIVTPFDKNEALDLDKMKHNLKLWAESELTGLLVLGSNGEFPYISTEEKIKLTEFVRKHWDNDRKLLAGSGCHSTAETIELTKAVAAVGADAVLVLPPFYYKGQMTDEVLYAHFERVADSSPVPVLLYNMPANTGINLSSSLVSRLSAHENIVGEKDSSGNIVQIAETVRSTPAGFSVLAGSAGFMLPSLSVGAAGAVVALGNVMPDRCCELYKLFREGRLEEATRLQHQLLEINHAVTAGMGVPALKAAMDMLGFQGGFVRKPLQQLPDDKTARLKDVLIRCGALK
ncbi:MAG: dihydrodipicolinate synthase family protein [Spirochaetales bacterium]|nr:dihydrodipicolinate synthase family protein [Spirochaetales bacterium]